MNQAFRVLAGTTIAVLTLTACGAKNTPTPAPLVPGQTPQAALPTAAPSDPCLNEYFPVRSTATWLYSSTGSPSGAYGFSKTVNEVQPSQFVVQVKGNGGGGTLHEIWLCTPSGLAAQNMTLVDTISLLALRRFSDLQVTNIVGVNLPSAIAPGTAWTYSYDIQGVEKDSAGAVSGSMAGKVSIAYTAKNIESVTVPAGTFNAMAVTVVNTTEITTNDASGTNVISSSSTYTAWYAPGVGWVKSSGTGKLGGAEYFETVELQSYQIP